MLSRLFRWFLSRLAVQDIGNSQGDIFFKRYDLIKTRWGSVYLHEFFRGDLDRCLHDHPWAFVAIILRGGYWEHVGKPPSFFGMSEKDADLIKRSCDESYAAMTGVRDTLIKYGMCFINREWRPPGTILYRPAAFAHRISLDETKPRPWSLVFVGRKSRQWGFYERSGWTAWNPGASPICETD